LSTIVQKGAPTVCPHCKVQQEGPVEDYVIPGYVGSASRATTDCDSCYEDFTVETLANGTFEITAE